MKINGLIILNPKFCNLTGNIKVLKLRVVIYIVSNLMLHYSTYACLVVYTLKSTPKYFRFNHKIRHFDIQVYLGDATITITFISGHCHIKKMAYIK